MNVSICIYIYVIVYLCHSILYIYMSLDLAELEQLEQPPQLEQPNTINDLKNLLHLFSFKTPIIYSEKYYKMPNCCIFLL